MQLTLNLGRLQPREPEDFGRLVQHLLWGIVEFNRSLLRSCPLPRLYEAGVVYRTDPPGQVSLADIQAVLERGHGHCAHLSAWLCAELLEQGIGCGIRIKWPWERRAGRRLYHVQVRLSPELGHGPPGLGQIPDPTNDQGQILDPSRVLGMGRHGR